MILTPMEAVIGAAMNALSRRFEWQADRFACELPDRLSVKDMSDMGARRGRALTTLHVKNLSTVWVDWLCDSPCVFVCQCLHYNQVFGVPPFTSDSDGTPPGDQGLRRR